MTFIYVSKLEHVITIVECLGTGSKKQISQFSNTLLVESFMFHSVSLI